MTTNIESGGLGDDERRQTPANGATVRRYLTEVFPGGDEATFAGVLAPDHVQHGPARYQTFVGAEETRRYAERLTRAFPDLGVAVTDVLSAGDLVRADARIRGLHTGALVFGDATFGPTGREASWRITLQCRIEDGKIAETWLGMDRTDLVRQLGLGDAHVSPASVSPWVRNDSGSRRAVER
jgi:predicted ester cyclase